MQDVVTIPAYVVVIFVVLLLVFIFLYLRKLPLQYTRKQLDDKIRKRLDIQRYRVKGDIGEQLAPHMKEFLEKYEPADAHFLGGKPVDYIIYKGYSRVYNTDEPIDEIVFLEVKTSKKEKASLNKNEAKIKEAIDTKRVSHDLITIHLDEGKPS